MNIEFLTTFLSVTQTQSFTKTAEISHLSQSTVSNRISELEKLFGHPLFYRNHQTLQLTPHGKSLLPYAQEIVALKNDAFYQLNHKNMGTPCVKVGIVHAYYDFILGADIKNMIKNKNYTVAISLKHTREIMQNVISGTYNLGIVHQPSNYSNYCSKLIKKIPIVLLSSDPTYRLGIHLYQLKNLPLYNSKIFDKDVETLLFSQQKAVFSIDIASKILPLLLQTNSYSFLPKIYANEHLETGELYEIPILDYNIPTLDFYLVYHESYKNVAHVNNLVSQILNT